MEMENGINKNDVTQSINRQLVNLRGANDNANGILNESESNYPYVIFQLFENKFAVNCKFVLSIEKLADTTEIANVSHEIRGITYFKNEAINVFDLRKVFGYISQTDYINSVVNVSQRIREHAEYAEDLKQCVCEGKTFTRTTNFHECKLGKWIDNYKTQSSAEVLHYIQKVEIPHEKFHRIAGDIKVLIDEGYTEKASKLLAEIQTIRTDVEQKLSQLNKVFLENIMELMIVLKVKDKKVGIIVDNADSVDSLNEIQYLPPAVILTEYVKRMGIRKKDQQIILILEALNFA